MAVLSYLISFVAEITQPDCPKAGGLAGALAASWLLVVVDAPSVRGPCLSWLSHPHEKPEPYVWVSLLSPSCS